MKRTGNIFIIITLITITVITIFSIQIFKRTIFRITSGFYHPFFGPVSNAENYSLKQKLQSKTKGELINELLKLQKINESDKAELQTLRSVHRDKAQLEELLKIRPMPGYKFIFAEIYIRDPVYWYENFLVNKGFPEGIVPGALVLCRNSDPKDKINAFSVLGRIGNVTDNTSVVNTIVSRNCKLSVILKDTQAAGILEGGIVKNDKPYVEVTDLPAFKNYKQGEEVYTSGFCSLSAANGADKEDRHATPGKIYVGKITDKIKRINQLTTTAELAPAVDLDSLHYVIIVVPDNKVRNVRNRK